MRRNVKTLAVVSMGAVLGCSGATVTGTGQGPDGGPSSDAAMDSWVGPVADSSLAEAAAEAAVDSSLDAAVTSDSASGTGNSDAQSTPVVLVDGLTNPSYIVTDGTNVYFTTYDSTTKNDVVMRVAAAGGPASMLAEGVGVAGGLAVYQGAVYWTNSVADAGGSVMVVGVDGGGPTAIAAGQTNPVGPVVDGTGIYWSQDVAGGSVMVAPLDGGAPSVVAAVQNSPNALVIVPSGLFWDSLDGVEWLPSPTGGGTPMNLGQTGASNNGAIAVDSTGVYTMGECAVVRTPFDGGAGVLLSPPSISGGPCISAGTTFAIDDANAYWPIMTGSGNPTHSGSVQSVPLAGSGSSPDVIASMQGGPNNVTVDSVYVYWTNHGVNGQPGQVMRANKP